MFFVIVFVTNTSCNTDVKSRPGTRGWWVDYIPRGLSIHRCISYMFVMVFVAASSFHISDMFFTIHRVSLKYSLYVYQVFLAIYTPPYILLRKYSDFAVASFATTFSPFTNLLIAAYTVSFLSQFYTSYWELCLFSFSYNTARTYLPNLFYCNFRSIFL